MSTPRKKRSAKKAGAIAARRSAAYPTEQAMLTEVRELIQTARQQVAQAVNARLTILHWQIGNRVHREILKEKRASYGAEIVSALSRELEAEFGRGFGRRNLFSMIRFAEVFPDLEIVQSLIAQLRWTYFLRIRLI